MLNVADNEHIHCVITYTVFSFRCMCLASHGASVVIGKRSGAAKRLEDDRQTMMISKLTTQTVKYIIFNCMPFN